MKENTCEIKLAIVQKYEEGMQDMFMNCHFQQGDDEKEKILRNDVKEVEKQRRGEVCESQTAQAASLR